MSTIQLNAPSLETRQTPQTVSGVCRHHGIATGQFYAWEKKARQGALEALRARKRGRKSRNPEMQLKVEITRLRAVVTELSAENLELKKGSGHSAAPPPRRRGEGSDPGHSPTGPGQDGRIGRGDPVRRQRR